jgi:hypothetical protein
MAGNAPGRTWTSALWGWALVAPLVFVLGCSSPPGEPSPQRDGGATGDFANHGWNINQLTA